MLEVYFLSLSTHTWRTSSILEVYLKYAMCRKGMYMYLYLHVQVYENQLYFFESPHVLEIFHNCTIAIGVHVHVHAYAVRRVCVCEQDIQVYTIKKYQQKPVLLCTNCYTPLKRRSDKISAFHRSEIYMKHSRLFVILYL